jgi:hypothetical protein
MCGVTVEAQAARLLAGRSVDCESPRWTDKWVRAATEVVARSSPWRWGDAVVSGRPT